MHCTLHCVSRWWTQCYIPPKLDFFRIFRMWFLYQSTWEHVQVFWFNPIIPYLVMFPWFMLHTVQKLISWHWRLNLDDILPTFTLLLLSEISFCCLVVHVALNFFCRYLVDVCPADELEPQEAESPPRAESPGPPKTTQPSPKAEPAREEPVVTSQPQPATSGPSSSAGVQVKTLNLTNKTLRMGLFFILID